MGVEVGEKLRNNFLSRNDEGVGNGKAKVATDSQDLGGKNVQNLMRG